MTLQFQEPDLLDREGSDSTVSSPRKSFQSDYHEPSPKRTYTHSHTPLFGRSNSTSSHQRRHHSISLSFMSKLLRSKRSTTPTPGGAGSAMSAGSEFGAHGVSGLPRSGTDPNLLMAQTLLGAPTSSSSMAPPHARDRTDTRTSTSKDRPLSPILVMPEGSSGSRSPLRSHPTEPNLSYLGPQTTDTLGVDTDPDNAPSPGSSEARSRSFDRDRRRRDSLVQRVAERLNSPSNADTKRKSRGKRSRRASTSSAISQGNSIAAALAKSGISMASPAISGPFNSFADDPYLQSSANHNNNTNNTTNNAASTNSRARAVSTGRSPYLLRPHDDDSDEGYGSENESAEESEGAVISHLPVTGFAVASYRRNAEFHGMFPTVDSGDYLIEDYGCALAKDILVHGRLYVSENHICFHSNLFGWVTDLIIPFSKIDSIEKKMTALVIPNAIGIVTTKGERHTFASLISRDSTYDVMVNIWRTAHPDAMITPQTTSAGVSRPPSPSCDAAAAMASDAVAHKATTCACGKAGQHYTEVALETTFPTSPEKVYNLMFNSGWMRTFLTDNQKLRDIESSEWAPDAEKKLARSMTYVKPLNGSIGPKQTKCHITDVHEHCDFDEYISMITTTKTPEVPSGGVFVVKTRTCITWDGPASTRLLVTTEVQWSGKSWVKGIIEKSAIDGQKQSHDALATEMRAHMSQHPTEFAVAGAEIVEVVEAADIEERESLAPTEAQEYAAQNRTIRRQDQDYWALQGSLDMVLQGFRSIGKGLGTAIDTVNDLLRDTPFSKTSIMMAVIALLFVSNIYTYLARPESHHKIKRIQRIGPTEDDVMEAVNIMLARRAAATPRDEAAELLRLLDEVEARAATLRASLRVLAASQASGDYDGAEEDNDKKSSSRHRSKKRGTKLDELD